MKDYLLLQKNGKLYAFFRQGQTCYWILIDRHYTEEAEQTLLQRDCSESVMKEMGLKFESVPVGSIASVRCRGYRGGDTLGFTMKDRKNRTYTLSDDTDDKTVDAIFAGISVEKSVVTETTNTADAYADGEEPTIRKWGELLNVIGFSLIILWFMIEDYSSCFLCAGCVVHVTSLILYLRRPQHFTLVGRKKGETYDPAKHKVDLGSGMYMPAVLIALMALQKFNFERATVLWVGALVVGTVGAGLLYFLPEEHRKKPWLLLGTAFCIGAMAFGVLTYGNHYAGNVMPEVGRVTELRETKSRKSKSYYCTVENEQGEERELCIGKKDYRSLKQGDRVRYYDGEGALGVYYTFFLEEIP